MKTFSPLRATALVVLGASLFGTPPPRASADEAAGLPVNSLQRVWPSRESAQVDESLASSWTALAPYPTMIAHYGFGQSGQYLLVVSGISNGSIVNTGRLYDATTNLWSAIADIPLGSEAPATASVNDKIYLADGLGGANQMRVYDLTSNSWSAGPARPGVLNSFGAAAGVYNGKVYVVGGGNSASTIVSIYDIVSKTWSAGAAAPAAVQLAGYKQIGQYLYIIGGTTAGSSANSNLSMRLDMASNTWSIGPAFTPQRADFALAASGTKIFALGGDMTGGGSADASAQVDVLDTAAWPGGSWTALPATLPVARFGNNGGFFTTARSGGEIWSTGGVALGNVYLTENIFRVSARAATCQDYTVTQSFGTIVPGTIDTGNHCDDCGTAINLPFPFRFYDQTFTSANINSNGYLQFMSSFTVNSNNVLPSAYLSSAILPFWDDLLTNGPNQGVFTSVQGSSPNRIFTIEWRASPFNLNTALTNFELRLFESSTKFEVIYGNTTGAFSGTFAGTIGAQRDSNASFFTPYIGPLVPVPAPGTRLIFSAGCCPPIAFSGAIGTNSGTYPGSSGTQLGRPVRNGIVSTCGIPRPYPGAFDAAPKAFDKYSFTNTGPATCVTFTVNTACSGAAQIFPTAYLGSFDPANIAANYLGDPGGSPSPLTSFSVDVPANSTVILVVTEATAGGACPSYNVTVEGLKCAPIPVSAVSRKTHGDAGTFDILLPLEGGAGVECRTGGVTNDYQLLVTFPAGVTVAGSPQARITAGSAMIGAAAIPNGGAVSVSGSTVIVPLTNVANAQNLTVTLNTVTDGLGGAGNVSIPMKVLIGDTNGDGSVNAGDAIQTRNRSGEAATPIGFRSDVNTDGTINSGDTIAVRSRSGTAIP